MRWRNVLTWARSGPRPATATLAALIGCVTIVAGATVAAAHPTPSLSVSKSAVRARPAPHILDFARDLHGARLKLPKGPHHVTVAWNVDGCDHDYGSANKCVPWTIPAPAGQGCEWLAAHGFGLLPVRGRDRLGLDTNHDGIACDKGDVGA
jgi:hypothetical protein